MRRPLRFAALATVVLALGSGTHPAAATGLSSVQSAGGGVIGAGVSPVGSVVGRLGLQVLGVQSVAAGVQFLRLVDPNGPKQIFVVRADLSGPATLDVGLPTPAMDGWGSTTVMARRHGALAAINGDFADWTGRPAAGFIEDGILKYTTTVPWSVSFGVAQDEEHFLWSRQPIDIRASARGGAISFPVDRWNDREAEAGEVAAFAGSRAAEAPQGACFVALKGASGPGWTNDGDTVRRTFTVRAAGCRRERNHLSGGVVLTAQPGSSEARMIADLEAGEQVRIAWSPGERGVLDLIGGRPRLVKDGRIMGVCEPDESEFCGRNPRTAVGVTEAGELLMVTVDGRSEESAGATMVELAQLMYDLGAVDALNLDGGGSTTMVVGGQIVNDPSWHDGERRVTSSLLILPGPDPGERGIPALLPEMILRLEAGSWPQLSR